MTGIERESAWMARLIEDLLVLAKLDEHRPLASDPIELVCLVLESVDTARTVGPTRPIRRGRTKQSRSWEIAARCVRSSTTFCPMSAPTHLLDEATVTVERRGKDAIIEISDDGPGFTANNRPTSSNDSFASIHREPEEMAAARDWDSPSWRPSSRHMAAASKLALAERGATFTVRLPAKEPDLRDDPESRSPRHSP